MGGMCRQTFHLNIKKGYEITRTPAKVVHSTLLSILFRLSLITELIIVNPIVILPVAAILTFFRIIGSIDLGTEHLCIGNSFTRGQHLGICTEFPLFKRTPFKITQIKELDLIAQTLLLHGRSG